MAETDWLAPLRGLLNVFSPSEAEAKVVAHDPQGRALLDAVARGAVLPEEQEPDALMAGRFDPVKKRLYQQVLQTAQARPETVNLWTGRQLPVDLDRAAGGYYPAAQAIGLRTYDPFDATSGHRYTDVVPTALNYQDTLTHELVHFLLPQIGKDLTRKAPPPSFATAFANLGTPELRTLYANLLGTAITSTPEQQHRFIDYLLGGSSSPVTEGPEGTTQPSLPTIEARTPFLTTGRPDIEKDMYGDVLRQMIRDPALLKRALEGLQGGPN